MQTDSRLEDVVEAWQAALLAGHDIPVAELCADCPELLAEVERRLELLRKTDSYHPVSQTGVSDSGVPTFEDETGSSHEPQAEMPATLGPYQVQGVLGHGGMGKVYLAFDPVLKRQVALKVMLPHLAAQPLAKARFIREAQAQAAVEHEHVSAIYHVGSGDPPFIAIPLLKGMTLAAALKANPRPPLAIAVRIGREIAEGLAAAHEHELIHRDIKPGNIWLEGSRKKVKILDFGLARAIAPLEPAADDEPLTAVGAIIGTPHYMSPEQAQGQALDARSDLFSLGIVLYQMATGSLPFTGPTSAATLLAILTQHPAEPAGVPPPLASLITRLLAKDPAERPASAEAVATELRQIEMSAEMPMDSQPTWQADPFADLATTELVSSQVLAHRASPRSSRRVLSIWLTGGLALLTATGIMLGMLAKSNAPRGVLDVQMDDPDLDIVVKQHGVIVRERTKLREFVLPPGEYTVEPADKREGVRIKPDHVRLEKDGRETISLKFEKKKLPKPKDTPVISDPDRHAAQILNLQAELTLSHALGKEVVVKRGYQLPSEAFVITRIDFLYIGDTLAPDYTRSVFLPAITNLGSLKAILAPGERLPFPEDAVATFVSSPCAGNVEIFIANGMSLTVKNFESWKRLPRLSYLGCDVAKGNEGLVARLKELPNVKELGLTLPNARLGAAEWESIGTSSYRTLALNHAVGLDRPLLRQLAAGKSLTTLSLHGSDVKDDLLAEIAKCQSLSVLQLTVTGISDAGLDHLKECASLRHLEAGRTKVTEAGVRKLAKSLPRCRILWDGATIEPNP